MNGEERTMTHRDEFVLNCMVVICEQAQELFGLHPGFQEFKVVREDDGTAKIRISEADDLILFDSPPWGVSSRDTR
jgi:hypothetical protein